MLMLMDPSETSDAAAATATASRASRPLLSSVSAAASRRAPSPRPAAPTQPNHSSAAPKARLAPTLPDDRGTPLDMASTRDDAAAAAAAKHGPLEPSTRRIPCAPQTRKPRALFAARKDVVARWRDEEAAERGRMAVGGKGAEGKACVSLHRGPDRKKGRKGLDGETKGVAMAV
ncbi:hypothetical protein PMIN06_012274 [Paraphaeosphaeria minitans]